MASFAPHIITFTDKPAETEPETTQAQQTEAVTTQAQTTGGSGSTSPSTGDSTVWIAFGVVALLAAAAIVIAVRKVRD
ncbi:MAG: LPXTG cell wall anchor domain-containing protein [Clostridia bacterium]|nr:LPXTG cell wall anchor domain-containing protein [Clostridia bacterium]